MSDVDTRVVAAVEADPAYAQALQAWRDCLRQRGYLATDPQSARDDVTRAYGSLPADQAWDSEHAQAVADAECNREEDLYGTGDRLHRAATAQVVGDRQHDLDDYRGMRTGAVARASQLLADVQPR